MLHKGIKRPSRKRVDYLVRVIQNRRTNEDNLRTFLQASKAYGNVQMSLENYASIMEVVNYKCPIAKLKKQLTDINNSEV
jgi:hypothetical protein